ncbi:hypothetical protein BGX33_012008, partial [Mortierella sp. NVP41]
METLHCRGNFTLGRFSKALHIISIIWLPFLSFILMFPSTLPLTKNNFNYASVVLAILTIISAASWLKARTDFTGGAKDISRASHPIPARSLDEIYPRKAPFPLSPRLSPRSLLPFHQLPSDETVQRFKSTVDKKTRPGTSTNGHNKIVPKRTGYPTTLTPPRRDPLSSPSSSSKKHHQGMSPNNLPSTASGTAANSRSDPRDQPCGQASNLTMSTVASVQSHPDSILGIPFTESPEMMHRELSVQSPTNSPSQPPTRAPAAKATATHSSLENSASAATPSGLILTRPFGPTDAAVPEISITPNNDTEPAVSESTVPSLSAIDSIFKLGQGLSNVHASGKNKVTASMNMNSNNNNSISNSRPRAGKTRAPTPYPASLADRTEESAVSDYAASMVEDPQQHPFPKTVLRLSPPSPPLHSKSGGEGRSGGSGDSIEEIVDNTNIALAAFPSISQFPTLDGYPLIKSPSTMDLSGGENSLAVKGGSSASGGGGNGDADRRPSNATTIRPMVLPLSRTPTVQANSQEYTHSSIDEDLLDGQLCQLAEADESYENECHHDYPVISISTSRLKILSPAAGGLFRLPNRDIGALTPSLALTPNGGGGGAGGAMQLSLVTHSTGPAATPTTPTSPNQQVHPQNQRHQQQQRGEAGSTSFEQRHDPIERLLLLQAK